MSCTIRKFTEQDRTTYLQLSQAFYHSDAVLHAVPEDNFHRTFDACLNDSPYTRGYIVQQGDQTAGYALVSFTWSNEVGGVTVLLEELFILPEFQGGGLGSQALQFLEEECGASAKRFRLEVTKSNQGAIRLYEKMGYHSLQYKQMIKDLP